MKCLKFLRTRKHILEQECAWNLYYDCSLQLLHAVWIVLIERPFWALTTYPSFFSVYGCWTNRTNIGTKWSTWIWKKYGVLKKQHTRCIMLILCQSGFKNAYKIGKAVNSIPPRSVEGTTKPQAWVHSVPTQYTKGWWCCQHAVCVRISASCDRRNWCSGPPPPPPLLS